MRSELSFSLFYGQKNPDSEEGCDFAKGAQLRALLLSWGGQGSAALP